MINVRKYALLKELNPAMENKENKSTLMHELTDKKSKFFTGKLLGLLLVVALLGISTGYFLARPDSKGGSAVNKLINKSNIPAGKTFGTEDTDTYSDVAEGELKEGGVEGEGEYHLVRPGGESQNVYLTSSLVDLSQFIDRKIKVWGETQKAQKVGWLMDVGRVQVLQ